MQAPSSSGINPLSMFPDISMYSRLLSFSICVGMDPNNWFDDKFSLYRFAKVQISCGISPMR